MAGIANWTDMEWDWTEDASRVAAKPHFTFYMSVCVCICVSALIMCAIMSHTWFPCDFIIV